MSKENEGSEFFEILKQYSYYFDSIKTKSGASNFNLLVQRLKMIDKHAYIIPKDILDNENEEIKYEEPEYTIKDSVLTLKLPALFGTLVQEHGQHYATTIHNALKEAYNNKINNIVVDLKVNYGGDFMPMLLGLNSLLPDNVTLLYEIDRNKTITPYVSIEHNKVLRAGKVQYEFDKEGTEEYFKFNNPNITVLTSQNTSSAGEFVALCLKINKNTIFRGEKTAGLLTQIHWGYLKSGVHYGITSALILDFNRQRSDYITPTGK